MKKEMMRRKYGVKAVLFLLIMVVAFSADGQSVSAAKKKTSSRTKAVYTIKKYKKKYSGTGKKITAKYRYDLPQLKGKTKAVKKINSSLKKAYTASLEDKKSLFSYAEEANSNLNFKDSYFCTTTCKVTYNKKGYVSFCFHHEWYAGGVHNGWTEGMTYSLKTGSKLNVSNVVSGNKKSVKSKIIKQYLNKVDNSSFRKEALNKMKISEFQFYLKGGKVIVCFGPYQPGGGNGQSQITLNGNYQ